VSCPTDNRQHNASIEADFVEVPAIAAPYLTRAAFVDVPQHGWQRVLDVYTDCETDCVFAVCAAPTTGRYGRYYRTHYSNTEHIVCAIDDPPAEVLREHCEELQSADELVAGFTRPDGVNRLREGLPGERVEIDGTVWEREQVSDYRYQWVQELDADQYDWDPDADDVSLVGVDTPVRVLSLEIREFGWFIQALETAGPNYHRPGYTEPIGSEFAQETTSAASALETIEQYLGTLS
jgi:hypothetical protein